MATQEPGQTTPRKAKGVQSQTTGSDAPASAREAGSKAAEPMRVSSVTRLGMITEAAYYLAQGRRFSPGCEVEDWLAAEREVDARLAGGGAAGPIDTLERERDELRVRIHLARLEARIILEETLARVPRWEVDWDHCEIVHTGSAVRGYSK